MTPEQWQRLTIGALLAGLVFELGVFFGFIHPRQCPACLTPYHRGRPCDWSKTP